MFIGRKQELDFLEERYKNNSGQLIVLYGRRRIGKTETLHQFCKDKPHIFYSCRECIDKIQLQKFSEKILKENIPASQYITEFDDWEKAFKSICELPYGNKKKLVVIDEFPYMCKNNGSIPSIIQNLWDETLKNENVMIILCGSAMSFIEKELLSEKNPLYGRATGVYKMNELSFYDSIKFFDGYSEYDKILAYSILGGIPHYLNQFDNSISLEENIKRNILTKGCSLYSEVEFMLKQELRETTLYNSIIEAIALGSTKLSEISNKSLINDNAKTTVYLKNLIELDIVKKEFSVSASTKEQSNRNRGIYKINDNYFSFWYAFVFNNYSELEAGDIDGVYNYMIQPNLHKYASRIFEDICHDYIRKLQQLNKLPFHFSKIGHWWGKANIKKSNGSYETVETEIDIMAMDTKCENYIIGECKFTNKPFTYLDYINTVNKNFMSKENTNIYYYLFSLSGFEELLIKEAGINDKLKLISACDIVDIY